MPNVSQLPHSLEASRVARAARAAVDTLLVKPVPWGIANGARWGDLPAVTTRWLRRASTGHRIAAAVVAVAVVIVVLLLCRCLVRHCCSCCSCCWRWRQQSVGYRPLRYKSLLTDRQLRYKPLTTELDELSCHDDATSDEEAGERTGSHR